jgi:hypothetical protein
VILSRWENIHWTKAKSIIYKENLDKEGVLVHMEPSLSCRWGEELKETGKAVAQEEPS